MFVLAAGNACGQGYTFLQKCADSFLGLELALDYCGRAIASHDLADDNLAVAYYNRAAILSRRRNGLPKALADLDESIRLHPRAASYVARGSLKSAKRDFDGALADYSDAIRLDSNLAEAYLLRSEAALRKGELVQSADDATQALKLDPVGPIVIAGTGLNMYSSRPRTMDRRVHDATAYKLRGIARFDRGDFAPAAQDLAETLRAAPGDTESALWLFLARARSGAAPQARTELAAHAQKLPEASWGRRIAALMLDESKPDALFAAVAEKGLVRQAQRCQASFYAGHWRLVRGEREAATTLLQRAKDRCLEGSNEAVSAAAELARLVN